MKIINNLDKLMTERGVSNTQLREGAELSHNTVLAWRRDHNQYFDRRILAKLCAFFNVDPGEIIVADRVQVAAE